MASRLPLKRRRSIPGFLRDARAIRRQLARADGMVGYALDAELARKTFWTFSVWQDQASLDAFASSAPHRAIIRRLRPLMGRPTSSSSRSRGRMSVVKWFGSTSRREFWPRPGVMTAAGLAGFGAAGGGLAGAEPVGLGAGLEDVGVEGDPVDDRGDQAGVGEDGAPFIRGWHMLILNYYACCLGNLRSGVSADL
jgi:hypothetical protein